jgi:hypothetical protein
MAGELPEIAMLRGGEVPPTAPPTYDFDNRPERDYQQAAAARELISPEIMDPIDRPTARTYDYEKPKLPSQRARWKRN